MASGAEAVARALRDWLAAHPHGAVAVGFSGGPDSTALLAVAAGLPEARARGLRALHVDHGLNPHSGEWARHCERLAARLGLICTVLRVALRPGGSGLEAAARRARYEAIAAALGAGEWLLTAHHAEDQAETVLLRLLRGAPPPLLAGMPPQRPLGRGFLARPLLALPRSALAAALAESGLPTLVDPANLDRRLDRGWLRSRVIPALAERWPRWAEGVAASATELATAWSAAAASLAAALGEQGESLALAPLCRLEPAERLLGLRAWLHRLGLPQPPRRRLEEFLRQLEDAARDRAPELAAPGYRLRRHRDRLWAVPDPLPRLPPLLDLAWSGQAPLPLPDGGELALLGPVPAGWSFRIRARRGGERIQLARAAPRRSVKELLRAAGLPPWSRDRLPLLWRGERLCAVGDRWLDADFVAELAAHGLALRHRPAPLPARGALR